MDIRIAWKNMYDLFTTTFIINININNNIKYFYINYKVIRYLINYYLIILYY
jgi:hypothetical protein